MVISNSTSKNRHPEQQRSQALLLVTFGSTYEGAHKTFATIRKEYEEGFPEADVYMCFTSSICIRRWYDKTGEKYLTPEESLENLAQMGYRSIVVQSLHLLFGYEYALLNEVAMPKFRQLHPEVSLSIGLPLLSTQEDIAKVGEVLYHHFESRLSQGEAWVLMGHGCRHSQYADSNLAYNQLNSYLQGKNNRILIGTVDYEDMLFENTLLQLSQVLPPQGVVNLIPLMSVAGDHTIHDLMGGRDTDAPIEEQSWRIQLEDLGYKISEENCHLVGLGDLFAIRLLWLEHTRQALEDLNQ